MSSSKKNSSNQRSVPPSASSSTSPSSRSSSCLKRSHSYFVMMPVVSVLLSLLLLVSPVSLVPSYSSLNDDPHASPISDQDTPQREQAASNVPRIVSKSATQTYIMGSTAEMTCNVEDLGERAHFCARCQLHTFLLPARPSLVTFRRWALLSRVPRLDSSLFSAPATLCTGHPCFLSLLFQLQQDVCSPSEP